MGQGFGAVGQALGQVGFSGCNRVRVLLQSIFKNAVCVGLGQGIKHLAAKADEHHAEQETGGQAKRENDRTTPECLGRICRVKSHPLRRLNHRAKRTKDAEGEHFFRRERPGCARYGKRGVWDVVDFFKKCRWTTQCRHGGQSCEEHPGHQQRPLQCIGPRHAAHAADHDVEHRHQRQEAGPDFERVFPGEQSFGNDAAGLNLNDHVRHGV